eukprot:1137007-Pelagomonas_calceolata.AAC.4
MSSTSACCPLCGEMDSIDHIALRCLNPTMNGIHINRQYIGFSSCVKALSTQPSALSPQPSALSTQPSALSTRQI